MLSFVRNIPLHNVGNQVTVVASTNINHRRRNLNRNKYVIHVKSCVTSHFILNKYVIGYLRNVIHHIVGGR